MRYDRKHIRKTVILIVPLFALLFLLSSCGGGGGGDSASAYTAVVSGRVTDTVQVESGVLGKAAGAGKAAAASGGSVAGLTVSITGCKATGVTDANGAFSFNVDMSCYGQNLIVTAMSSDGKYVAKIMTDISSQGDGNSVVIGADETVEAMIMEKIGEKVKEVYSEEYVTLKSALGSIDNEFKATVVTDFDTNADGKLTISDLDSGGDGVINATEMSNKEQTINNQAVAVGRHPDVINDYHALIVNAKSTASVYASDYLCSYDKGTPDDTSDDLPCWLPFRSGDFYKYSISAPIESLSYTFSNIRTDTISEDEMQWTEHIKVTGVNYLGCNSTIETVVDNDFTYKLKKVDGEWKIASESRKTGRLVAEVKTDKTTYKLNETIKINISVKNTGNEYFTGYLPEDNQILVIRPDGKRLMIRYKENFLCGNPITGWEGNESIDINLTISEDIFDSWDWIDVDAYPDDETAYELDMTGEYKLMYIYEDYYGDNCYDNPESPSGGCVVSNTATFNITD